MFTGGLTQGARSVSIAQKDSTTTNLSGSCSASTGMRNKWKPGWDPAKLKGPAPVIGEDVVYRATVDRSPPSAQKTIYKYKAVVSFTSRHRAEVTFTQQYTTTVASTGYKQTCKATGKDVVRGPK